MSTQEREKVIWMSENNKSEIKRADEDSSSTALLSSGSLGWQIRKIMKSNGVTVMLDDGVSFDSPCFSGAMAGDIWAVKHEPGVACFGSIKQAVLLQPVGR